MHVSDRTPVPGPLRWAIILVAAEVLALCGTVAVLALGGAPRLAGFFAMWAVGAGLVLWGLLRRKAAARAPAIVLQLLATAAGTQAIATGGWVLGVVLIAVSVTGVLLLLSPGSREGLGVRV